MLTHIPLLKQYTLLTYLPKLICTSGAKLSFRKSRDSCARRAFRSADGCRPTQRSSRRKRPASSCVCRRHHSHTWCAALRCAVPHRDGLRQLLLRVPAELLLRVPRLQFGGAVAALIVLMMRLMAHAANEAALKRELPGGVPLQLHAPAVVDARNQPPK